MGQIGGEIDVAEDVGVGEAEVGVQRTTRFPADASLIARLTAILLLPTPPLPLVTAMTVARVAWRAIRRSCVA